jgi:rSAM/selenodomain-associated transferase 2
MNKLSVIVPMLNEERTIVHTLEALRLGAPESEIVVVDGGSTDRSRELAIPLADRVIEAPRGRARQMNTGASVSSGDVLAFVHADTIVPSTFAADIFAALSVPEIVGGRFDVLLDSDAIALRTIAAMISLRSRLSRTGTGDQAIFVRRSIFERLGGFPDLDLCEDLDFTRRMKRAGRFACLRSCVTTSSRRWTHDGIFATVIRMWTIRVLYLCGVSPAYLKKMYTDTR